jgi:protein-L-isoaspartate O-methyltransferase
MTEAPASIDNPFFARLWSSMSAREPESIRKLRRENLAGLTGRVLEVGAGTGTNFALYPTTVTEVVAIEPELRLAERARQAAGDAPIPITVSTETVERFASGEPFDAVVCSLVLCSVADPDAVLRQLFSTLRVGGELRYLEHVASTGLRAHVQRFADATVWPRMLGNCHTHRDTELSIVGAGFALENPRREWMLPKWVPMPVAETAIGRAVRPA